MRKSLETVFNATTIARGRSRKDGREAPLWRGRGSPDVHHHWTSPSDMDGLTTAQIMTH